MRCTQMALNAVAGALFVPLLAGCTGPQALSRKNPLVKCPRSLLEGVQITASVAQSAIPAAVSAPSGPVKLVAGVGRRLLLALNVPSGLSHLRLLSDSLEVITLGGTLAGWAKAVDPAAAGMHESIQVSDGLLRITPFVPGRMLASYTQSIDVLVVPGGDPVAGVALRPGRMWDDGGTPTAPGRLKITLLPILHLKVLDVVAATVQYDFVVLHLSGAHERWQCSVQSDVQLVDHRAALPNLWVLRREAPLESSYPTLTLYNQSVGAFPAVFLDPATARGFARWLSETHAMRVGEYKVGLASKTNATGFQTASNDDLNELDVEQFGDKSPGR